MVNTAPVDRHNGNVYIICIVERNVQDELGRTISVRPPTVNWKIKSKARSMADDHLVLPPWRVDKQLNT